MAVTRSEFLDQSGVKKLAQSILDAADKKIRNIIITDAASGYESDDKVLSAQAILDVIGKLNDPDNKYPKSLYAKLAWMKNVLGTDADDTEDQTLYGSLARVKEALKQRLDNLPNLRYEIVEGPLSDTNPSDKDPDVIYLHHDGPGDDTWEMCFWNESMNQWICVGDPTVELSAYWKRDDATMLSIQDEMLDTIEDDTIKKDVAELYEQFLEDHKIELTK